MPPSNELRISGEGAARQPPRRPRLEPTAWRLPEPARPRPLHALVRRPAYSESFAAVRMRAAAAPRQPRLLGDTAVTAIATSSWCTRDELRTALRRRRAARPYRPAAQTSDARPWICDVCHRMAAAVRMRQSRPSGGPDGIPSWASSSPRQRMRCAGGVGAGQIRVVAHRDTVPDASTGRDCAGHVKMPLWPSCGFEADRRAAARPAASSRGERSQHEVAAHAQSMHSMRPPNDLRISGEGAARQPPRRPRLEPTAWRLPEPARPRPLHALVRQRDRLRRCECSQCRCIEHRPHMQLQQTWQAIRLGTATSATATLADFQTCRRGCTSRVDATSAREHGSRALSPCSMNAGADAWTSSPSDQRRAVPQPDQCGCASTCPDLLRGLSAWQQMAGRSSVHPGPGSLQASEGRRAPSARDG